MSLDGRGNGGVPGELGLGCNFLYHATIMATNPNLDKHQALELFRAQRLPEARVALEAACAQNDSDAEVWYLLGMLNGMQLRYTEAERCCRRAIELKAGFPRRTAIWA